MLAVIKKNGSMFKLLYKNDEFIHFLYFVDCYSAFYATSQPVSQATRQFILQSLVYFTCFLCFSEQNYFKAMNSRRVHALLFLLSSLEKEEKNNNSNLNSFAVERPLFLLKVSFKSLILIPMRSHYCIVFSM